MAFTTPPAGARLASVSRVVSVLSLTAMAGYGVLIWTRLPPRIATHFALDGTPDGWLRRGTFLALMGAMVLVVNLLLPALPRLGPAALNVPHKNWWLETEARRRELMRRGKILMALTLAYTNLILLVAVRAVVERNGGPVLVRLPPEADLLFILLGSVLFVVGLLAYAGWLFRPDPACSAPS